jgi:hypothetical protein
MRHWPNNKNRSHGGDPTDRPRAAATAVMGRESYAARGATCELNSPREVHEPQKISTQFESDSDLALRRDAGGRACRGTRRASRPGIRRPSPEEAHLWPGSSPGKVHARPGNFQSWRGQASGQHDHPVDTVERHGAPGQRDFLGAVASAHDRSSEHEGEGRHDHGHQYGHWAAHA